MQIKIDYDKLETSRALYVAVAEKIDADYWVRTGNHLSDMELVERSLVALATQAYEIIDAHL